MKTRNGFVSNSSSSSFIIHKKDLTDIQIQAINDYEFWAEKFGMLNIEDKWGIDNHEFTIEGETGMDNFDMHEFFDKIGIDPTKVEWDD